MPTVAALLFGLKLAVVAIVAEAFLRIAEKSLKNWFFVVLAAASFIAIYVFSLPLPIIVFGAAALGFAAKQVAPQLFGSSGTTQSEAGTLIGGLAAQIRDTGWRPTLSAAVTWLTVRAVPLIAVWLSKGQSIFTELSALLSKAAIVTFGGAYAVFAHVGQEAVQHFAWLKPQQMVDALALTETTPGPLIMVNKFVGYLAAYQNPRDLSPACAGFVGGLLTTWVSFALSFLMIFLLAPYIEVSRKNAFLSTALAAVSATVVGEVLNLGVTFMRNTLIPHAVARCYEDPLYETATIEGINHHIADTGGADS